MTSSRQPTRDVTLSNLTLCHLTLVVLLFVDVTSGSTNPMSPSSSCKEPSDVMEMYRHLRRHVINTASDFYAGEGDNPDIPHHTNVSVIALQYPSCGYTGLRCSCPQKQEENFDPNRIPRILLQASCCRRNSHVGPSWRLECRDVTHHVPVLRRTSCIDGEYHYERVWENVPVGCSCFSLPRFSSIL